jgi:glycosyltransferase involved in cell wall biosynthesis
MFLPARHLQPKLVVFVEEDEIQKFKAKMTPNSHLSIVIPTYNRAEFLDRCLGLIIPSARKLNIEIYVSDNSSEDNTGAVVSRRISEYSLIKYSCNSNNLGADKNFQIALGLPVSDYIWLLGDTYWIESVTIDFFIESFLNKKNIPDAVIFNVNKRVIDIGSNDYFDKNKLLSELGWHMTCMSSLVYSRHLIMAANFDRYRKTNFIQTGIIFEYIENKDFFIRWVSEHSVFPLAVKGVVKNSWQDSTFEIWVDKWSNFIFSLPPSYEIGAKLKCIKDHGIKSGIFSLKSIVCLRVAGILKYSVYKKYSKLLPLAINYPVSIFMVISLTPIIILKYIIFVFRWFNRGVKIEFESLK